MPEFEFSDGNGSAHSLDKEYGGLYVKMMRTPTAKKLLTMENVKLLRST